MKNTTCTTTCTTTEKISSCPICKHLAFDVRLGIHLTKLSSSEVWKDVAATYQPNEGIDECRTEENGKRKGE
jgi:exo-beta-1,3-glucanase (GH17 family)